MKKILIFFVFIFVSSYSSYSFEDANNKKKGNNLLNNNKISKNKKLVTPDDFLKKYVFSIKGSQNNAIKYEFSESNKVKITYFYNYGTVINHGKYYINRKGYIRREYSIVIDNLRATNGVNLSQLFLFNNSKYWVIIKKGENFGVKIGNYNDSLTVVDKFEYYKKLELVKIKKVEEEKKRLAKIEEKKRLIKLEEERIAKLKADKEKELAKIREENRLQKLEEEKLAKIRAEKEKLNYINNKKTEFNSKAPLCVKIINKKDVNCFDLIEFENSKIIINGKSTKDLSGKYIGEIKNDLFNGKGQLLMQSKLHHYQMVGNFKASYFIDGFYEKEKKYFKNPTKDEYSFKKKVIYEGITRWNYNLKERLSFLGTRKLFYTDGAITTDKGEFFYNINQQAILTKGKRLCDKCFSLISTYKGDFINSYPYGSEIFEGEFKTSTGQYKKGTLTDLYGIKYHGSWKEDKLDGDIKITLPDNSFYEFNYKNGEIFSRKGEWYEKLSQKLFGKSLYEYQNEYFDKLKKFQDAHQVTEIKRQINVKIDKDIEERRVEEVKKEKEKQEKASKFLRNVCYFEKLDLAEAFCNYRCPDGSHKFTGKQTKKFKNDWIWGGTNYKGCPNYVKFK